MGGGELMKAIVLSSGGIDSTTCLALAVKEFGSENVASLSIFYGQKHKKEIQAARNVADYYKIKHLELDMTLIFKDSKCSLLEENNTEIPEGSYSEQLKDSSTVSTYVPFRNGLFLSAAASIAISNDCEFIYYGAHADDAAGNAYPDCSPLFNQYISKAIEEGSGCGLKVIAPFINKNKADVVRIGLEMHAPYELTWSCYKGEDKPCGKCGTCIDRQMAFAANGVSDPALQEKI